MTRKRIWLLGLMGALGIVTAAAGMFYWYILWVWGATDLAPYREAEAIAAAGCVILIVAAASSGRP